MSGPARSGDNRERRNRKDAYVQNLSKEAEAASAREKIIHQMEKRRRRRLTAYILFFLASSVAVSHLLTHAGMITIIGNQGLADLVIGYPTAVILALGGLMLLPAQRY